MELWNNEKEVQFFHEALTSFASVEQLFYRLRGGYFAYVPKGLNAEGQTLQSRNSLIGQYTERFCKKLFEPIARELGLFAINGVVCEDLALTRQSSADMAFCRTDKIIQSPDDIKLIFEIKMSVVSNYKFTPPDRIDFVGDYTKHKGTPSLLRSDSMLKAIGKSINIRVSGFPATKIPIIILGNSPIQESYHRKVDFLKKSGVVQGFWSLNPYPTSSGNTSYTKTTENGGFQTIERPEAILELCKAMISSDLNYFSSMISKAELGKFITLASKEPNDIARAERFLTLIRS